MVGTHRLHSGVSAFRYRLMNAMQWARRDRDGANEGAAVAGTRARGESLGAEMVWFSASIMYIYMPWMSGSY